MHYSPMYLCLGRGSVELECSGSVTVTDSRNTRTTTSEVGVYRLFLAFAI